MIFRRLILVAVVLAGFWGPGKSDAHALEPGFLELQNIAGSEWRVTWRKPQVSGQPMSIDAVLPEGCDKRRGPSASFDGRAFLSSWIALCKDGIAGGEIRIDGLERTRTDVLVRYSVGEDTSPKAVRLTAANPAFTVPMEQGGPGMFGTYFFLGVDHILMGIDHLMFVFLLVLLIRNWRRLFAAVTSFTMAHSLSLGAASLGWIIVPARPVEAIVALSIVFLAAELLQTQKDRPRLTERYPWSLGFVFGLLHGLGFARALLEIGLPERDVLTALFAFNVGVEAGQILFIVVVLAVGAALRRLYPGRAQSLNLQGSMGVRATAYCIGSLAAFWVLERIAVIVT